MDYVIIASILLTIIIISLLFTKKDIKDQKHKIKPKIVRPAYWITPTGPSWKPPAHRVYNY